MPYLINLGAILVKLEKLQNGIVVEWIDSVRANLFFDPDFFMFDKFDFSAARAEIQLRSRGQVIVSSALLEHGMIGIIYNPSIIKCFSRMSLDDVVSLIANAIAKTKMTTQNDNKPLSDSRSTDVERLSGGTMVLPGNDR